MVEIPKFAKFLAEPKKPGKKPAEADKAAEAGQEINALKQESLAFLFGQYDKIKADSEKAEAKGDLALALELVNESDKKLDEIENLQNDKNPLIDDLEKILGKAEAGTDYLSLVNEAGQETRLEMAEQVKYWTDFYQKKGIDWIEMPEKIELTAEDQEELAKGAKALCPDGNFEKLKLLIIPANLADTGEKYKKLNTQMSEGYKETWQSDDFKKDGGIEGLKNKSDKLKIILVKDIQNLKDDEVYAKTLNKSVVKSKDESIGWLEGKDGLFEQTGLKGIDASVYLVWQREYFERTGQHLDADGYIWLTENRRPPSGRAPYSRWGPGGGRLGFRAVGPGGHDDDLGCRLSSSREK